MIFPHLFACEESDNKTYKRVYLRNYFFKKRTFVIAVNDKNMKLRFISK